MNEILQGAILGVTLSFLIGPVFFALLQTGIEYGFRAGVSYSSGVWLSDFLIILLIYKSMAAIAEVVKSNEFVLYVGIVGAIILIGFGLSSLLTKIPNKKNAPEIIEEADTNNQPIWKFRLKLFTKGFIINTINPFTIIFWLGVNTVILSKETFTNRQAFLYFGSILFTLVITDLLKILLAKRIGSALKPLYILRMRQIAGVLLMISGLVMLYRVL